METESRLSYENMKELVRAMSDVTGRLVPGIQLFYRERRLRQHVRPGESADLNELAVVQTRPGWNDVPVRGAILDIGYEPYGRKKLLRRLAADGWPKATSGEEMKFRLTIAGDGAFDGICRRYAEYDPPKETVS